jgi:hypothetical protein
VRPLAPALILLAVLAAPALGEETAAVDIIRNPSAYRDRYLTVRGTMMNVRPVTAGGIAIPTGTVFDLVAGPAILVIFSPVPAACPIGSAVTVDGRFAPVGQVRQQLYTNLIEATLVSCR